MMLLNPHPRMRFQRMILFLLMLQTSQISSLPPPGFSASLAPMADWHWRAAALLSRECRSSAVPRQVSAKSIQNHGLQTLSCTIKPSKVRRQREQIDKALGLLDKGMLENAHWEMTRESAVCWDDIPKELDPHWVTYRGVTLQSGIPETSSIKAMKENLNPRSIRKRSQIQSFYNALKLLNPPPGTRVVDFGSGSGNLVLPLAYLFPALSFVAVDLKEHAVLMLQQRAEDAGLSNCQSHTGFIEAYDEPFGVAMGLHVCGQASNAVLESAISNGAAFLLSPCCIGKINTGLQPSLDKLQKLQPEQAKYGKRSDEYPLSRWLSEALDSATYALIAGAADRSEVPTPDVQVQDAEMQEHFRRGGLCKIAVELDRLEWTRERGYDTFLVRMKGLEDYAKRELLVGLPQGGRGAEAFKEGLARRVP